MLFENDFVLARVLPIGTGLNNTTTTTAIAKASAVLAMWLFAMILMYSVLRKYLPQVVYLRYLLRI